ncbi:hypothetical protein LCGC14_0895810 [marine sediment metagenome]|uniref:Uncharacterized protein n=1 Tax=marine sediment metagenome TaxID=412755 RepID=A0A0F9P2S7_9ZZZZ
MNTKVECISKPDECPFREWSDCSVNQWCKFENNSKDNVCNNDDEFPVGCTLIKQNILIKKRDESAKEEQ